MLPLVEPIDPLPDPADVFCRLASGRHCVFFDSVRRDRRLGRYSFVACDPIDFIRIETPNVPNVPTRFSESPASATVGRQSVLFPLQQRLERLPSFRQAELPPFQGGLAGVLSYELGHAIERLPPTRYDEFHFPAVAVGLYDVIVAFDHWLPAAWIISQGWPETDPVARRRRAAARLASVRHQLRQPVRPSIPSPPTAMLIGLAPQYPTGRWPALTSTFSAEGYLDTVRRAIDYIAAGDIFQVNLSQRLLMPAQCGSVELYLRLRRCNPAPFAGYCDLGDFQVASASPECYLRVADGVVETRPIKGTRPLTGDPNLDEPIMASLAASPKDRAENVMIVDLLRNDLGRVCQPGTIRVSELCALERYAHVVHLVSAVEGRLAAGRTPLDLLEAAFPGGSITGAPKIRAMQIISELEPTARGAYCGSLFYLSPDGRMDSNLLIRTITAGQGLWQAPVGGGVVADSQPDAEYRETWDKARGLVEAMTGEPPEC